MKNITKAIRIGKACAVRVVFARRHPGRRESAPQRRALSAGVLELETGCGGGDWSKELDEKDVEIHHSNYYKALSYSQNWPKTMAIFSAQISRDSLAPRDLRCGTWA